MISAEDFAKQQRADLELKSAVEYLEGNADVVPRAFRRGFSSFLLQNDVLVKKNFTPLRADYLLIVPSALRPEVLHALHDGPTAGHLGFSRTLSRIQEKYYYPRVTADVAHQVDMPVLTAMQDTTDKASGLSTVDGASLPTISIDQDGFVRKLPTSASGNKRIVVAAVAGSTEGIIRSRKY